MKTKRQKVSLASSLFNKKGEKWNTKQKSPHPYQLLSRNQNGRPMATAATNSTKPKLTGSRIVS